MAGSKHAGDESLGRARVTRHNGQGQQYPSIPDANHSQLFVLLRAIRGSHAVVVERLASRQFVEGIADVGEGRDSAAGPIAVERLCRSDNIAEKANRPATDCSDIIQNTRLFAGIVGAFQVDMGTVV